MVHACTVTFERHDPNSTLAAAAAAASSAVCVPSSGYYILYIPLPKLTLTFPFKRLLSGAS